jgi:hypothetical protein
MYPARFVARLLAVQRKTLCSDRRCRPPFRTQADLNSTCCTPHTVELGYKVIKEFCVVIKECS